MITLLGFAFIAAAIHIGLRRELRPADLSALSAARLPAGPGSSPATGYGRGGEPDTLDRMLAAAERDAYLLANLGAEVAVTLARTAPSYLPAPAIGPRDVPRTSLVVRRNRGGEPDLHGWARIAWKQTSGWRMQRIISRAREGHRDGRHEARMATIAARCADPMPHLGRSWQDDTGSFAAFCEAT
jgi:hypothetical protein